MWNALKSVAIALLSSKKFGLALVSALVWGVGKIGLDVSFENMLAIVGPFWGALGGVMLQDVGKEAAKIKAAAVPVLPAKK